MHKPSDEELMLAVRDGDLAAFEKIVIRNQEEAWRVAYRFTGDAVEAEDLAQEAFLRILDAVGRYKPTATFRTYLFRVLTHLCLDHVRKKRPIPIDPLPQTTDGRPSPPRQVGRQERDERIQSALNALPANYRMVVVLRYFEWLSGPEIAKEMALTSKAVERLLSRAREALEPRLRHLLDE